MPHPQPIYQYSHDFNGNENHKHTDTAWALVADEPPSCAIGAGESDRIKAFTRDELVALPPDMTNESVRKAALYVIDVCLSSWERVDPAEFN